MEFNLFKKPQTSTNYSNIKEEIICELLRQVCKSYSLALSITAASSLMTLCGVGFLYFNKISEANLTASSGVLATLTSVQYANQKKEELCEILENLLE